MNPPDKTSVLKSCDLNTGTEQAIQEIKLLRRALRDEELFATDITIDYRTSKLFGRTGFVDIAMIFRKVYPHFIHEKEFKRAKKEARSCLKKLTKNLKKPRSFCEMVQFSLMQVDTFNDPAASLVEHWKFTVSYFDPDVKGKMDVTERRFT